VFADGPIYPLIARARLLPFFLNQFRRDAFFVPENPIAAEASVKLVFVAPLFFAPYCAVLLSLLVGNYRPSIRLALAYHTNEADSLREFSLRHEHIFTVFLHVASLWPRIS